MTFTPSELKQLRASDAAESSCNGGGRAMTNPVSVLFYQEFGCCPQSLYDKARRNRLELSPEHRLQWLAWRKLHSATQEEREMLTRSVLQRLRKELAKLKERP